LKLLSTKDEIEKMLEDIQKDKKTNSTKNKYQDMSIDDLLNTISLPSRPDQPDEPEIRAEAEKRRTAESVIENIRKSKERYNIPEPEPELRSESESEEISESEPEEILESELEPEEVPESEYEPEEIPFRKIFDENPENIAAEKKEVPEPDEEYEDNTEVQTEIKVKPLHSVIGIILLIFSLIGIICTVNYSIKYIRSFTKGESRQEEIAGAVYPAVIMDIEAFQNGNELSSQQVITASVWKLIISGEIEKYDRTFDIISVPAVDIEAEAVKLFNTEFPSLEHQTVGSGEMKFYYNQESSTYNIPSRPMLFSYKPKVTALSKDGEIYTAEVEYIQEQPSWMKEKSGDDSEASKTVKFRLKSDGDDYSILSMEIIKLNQAD